MQYGPPTNRLNQRQSKYMLTNSLTLVPPSTEVRSYVQSAWASLEHRGLVVLYLKVKRTRKGETMFGLNPWELGLIFLAIMLLFGAKRVPEIARSFGKGVREFKSSIEGKDDGAEDDAEEKPVETSDKSS